MTFRIAGSRNASHAADLRDQSSHCPANASNPLSRPPRVSALGRWPSSRGPRHSTPGDLAQRAADQMNDSQLYLRLGNTASMASGRPLNPSTAPSRMSSSPRSLSSVSTLSQNFGPWPPLPSDPKSEQFLLALDVDSQRQLDRLVLDMARHRSFRWIAPRYAIG